MRYRSKHRSKRRRSKNRTRRTKFIRVSRGGHRF